MASVLVDENKLQAKIASIKIEAINSAIEECAKVADMSAASWRSAKKKLRPEDEEGGHMYAAHDRYRNYITNAETMAQQIRALKI